MAKIKSGKDTLLTRVEYNALRKMDRSDTENFIQYYYDKGYLTGYAKGKEETAEKYKCETKTASPSNIKEFFVKFKDELLALLNSKRGIGAATTNKVKDALDSMNATINSEED
jgi:hypothetical protein